MAARRLVIWEAIHENRWLTTITDRYRSPLSGTVRLAPSEMSTMAKLYSVSRFILITG